MKSSTNKMIPLLEETHTNLIDLKAKETELQQKIKDEQKMEDLRKEIQGLSFFY